MNNFAAVSDMLKGLTAARHCEPNPVLYSINTVENVHSMNVA